jgi:hypothetical protein
MANTAISQIAASSVVLEGKDRVKKVSGKLAGQYLPGDWVEETATNTWTQISVTNKLAGVLEFKKRTSSTFGEVDIDATYTDGTAINVEIIIGPRDGTVKVAAKVEDLGSDYYYGELLAGHSGGSLELQSTQGVSYVAQAIVSEDGYTDDDTVGALYMI